MDLIPLNNIKRTRGSPVIPDILLLVEVFFISLYRLLFQGYFYRIYAFINSCADHLSRRYVLEFYRTAPFANMGTIKAYSKLPIMSLRWRACSSSRIVGNYGIL